ncbi:MAG: hypothetical protein NZ516_01905 [Raineya sp.]|nr:hypothetical protein [Raineya sp.]
MKRLASILFAVWITLTGFFPKADTDYLADIGSLISHFQEHTQQENISFWHFLWLHYTQTEHQKQDHKHRNLPFHHSHAECSHVAILPVSNLEFLPCFLSLPIEKNYFDLPSLYCFQFIDENFQPPRP